MTGSLGLRDGPVRGPRLRSTESQGHPLHTPSLLHLRRFGNASALADAFAGDPDLGERDVHAQQAALDGAFGPFSAPLAAELRHLGWQAEDLILGVPSIRDAWIRQHGPLPRVRGVDDPNALLALGEIRRTRPEVVLDGNLSVLDRVTAPEIRARVPETRLLVGRMGTAKRFHRALHLDVILVPCHVMGDALRPLIDGAVHVLPHSFNPAALRGLAERDVRHQLVFAGALGPRYVERHRVLMALFEATPIEAWLGFRKGTVRTDDGWLLFNGASRPSGSAQHPLGTRSGAIRLPVRLLREGARRSDRFSERFNAALAVRSGANIPPVLPMEDPAARFADRCHPTVGGREYLNLLRHAGTVVHREGDDMDTCGGALRLFETTGVGAALLADRSIMVEQLFEDGREIVLYEGPEDAVEKALWLTDHPVERERIAEAGQARTLRDHATPVRAARLAELLSAALS